MDRDEADGLFKQILQIFSSRSKRDAWLRLTEEIEHSFAQKRFVALEKKLDNAVTYLDGQQDHPEYPARLHQLAGYFEQYAGNFKRSEELYKQAAARFKEKMPDDPLKAAPSLNNLAVLLIHQRRYSDAEPLIRELLLIVEEQLGREHLEYATCLDNLAAVLRHTDRETEAQEARERALQIRQENRRKQQT